MAIFDKPSTPAPDCQGDLRIPENSTFTGDIATIGNAQIDGVIEGNVVSESGNIQLGIDGRITGDVQGTDIAISGNIQGDISARGQLCIYASAEVFGNVRAISLLIEREARFQGSVSIGIQDKYPSATPGDLIFFSVSEPK